MLPAAPHPTAQEAQLHAALTGAVLRLLRERQGLSQAGLGRRAGLSQRDLSRLETGDGRADAVRLLHLAAALQLRPEDLAAFIQDAWGRAGRAAAAAIGTEPAGPWWASLDRTVGPHGVRCLFDFAAAAALHPWPR